MRYLMVYTFLLLLTSFVIFIWIFAIKNDFDSSLAEILYTAIGAVLVSSYFVYKSVYIDENQTYLVKVPVVVLLDRNNGHFYSMFQNHITSSPEDRSLLEGLKNFGSLYTLGNKVNNEKNEIKVFQQRMSDDKAKTFPDYILEDFESKLISWLQLSPQLINLSSFSSYYLGGGSSGNAIKVEAEKNFIHTEIPLSEQDGLPNLNYYKTIFLRKGAVVDRVSGVNQRNLIINNIYSKIAISTQFKSAAKPSAFSDDDKRISKVLNIPITDLEKMDYILFEVSFSFEVNKWRKLSQKSRNDRVWFEKLVNNFTNDFSWNVLKDYL